MYVNTAINESMRRMNRWNRIGLWPKKIVLSIHPDDTNTDSNLHRKVNRTQTKIKTKRSMTLKFKGPRDSNKKLVDPLNYSINLFHPILIPDLIFSLGSIVVNHMLSSFHK